MKNVARLTVGLLSVGMLALATGPSQAATGTGPYYAEPGWDQKLQCTAPATCPRFIVLTDWSSQAVLDRETGLVREQSPDTATLQWGGAAFTCATKNVGGRKGWRLPSMDELASLIDPSVFPSLALPAGHPFTNVQAAPYWSATTVAVSTSSAWLVDFNLGSVFTNAKTSPTYLWCVRGGGPLSEY